MPRIQQGLNRYPVLGSGPEPEPASDRYLPYLKAGKHQNVNAFIKALSDSSLENTLKLSSIVDQYSPTQS